MASKQAKVAQRDASQKLTKKNLYFQRLLLLRYLVAFFFFFNLNWLLAQSIEYVRIVLWISGVFAWSGIRKLKKIFRNKDRHWQWIREFEEIERKGD